MMEFSRWKVWLVALAATFGLWFSLPNFLPKSLLEKAPFLPSKALNLGLDLRGGSYLLLEVDTDDMFAQKRNNLVEDVRAKLREKAINFSGLGIVNGAVHVQITDPAQLDAADKLLLAMAVPTGNGTRDLDVRKGDNQSITMSFTKDGMAADSLGAVNTSLEVIRKRIDSLGTKEPSIVRQGLNRIVVEVPGESDPEQLKRVIGQTASLSFQMVDEDVTVPEAMGGHVPPGDIILPYPDEHEYGQLVVKRRVDVSGKDLHQANVGTDRDQRPAIEFSFNSEGAQKFGLVTSNNIGKRFAIVLDGKVMSAPHIESAITGGSGIITGNFTYKSAKELVDVLNSGALPAKINIEEQRTVTAELGADSVAKGQLSTLIAFLAVLTFMILAYGFLFGGISVIALFVNLLLLLACMSITQATLTLPGIAGLILTLAMAVDANVLIYERMREEARSGRSLISALDAGFSRAVVTIIDANITTIFAAVIMYFFGAGPVRGFAWTLGLGVMTSVFSAVMVAQVMLSWWFRTTKPKKLPIA